MQHPYTFIDLDTGEETLCVSEPHAMLLARGTRLWAIFENVPHTEGRLFATNDRDTLLAKPTYSLDDACGY